MLLATTHTPPPARPRRHHCRRRDDAERNKNLTLHQRLSVLAKLAEKGIFLEQSAPTAQAILQFAKKYFRPVALHEHISMLFVRRHLDQLAQQLPPSEPLTRSSTPGAGRAARASRSAKRLTGSGAKKPSAKGLQRQAQLQHQYSSPQQQGHS